MNDDYARDAVGLWLETKRPFNLDKHDIDLKRMPPGLGVAFILDRIDGVSGVIPFFNPQPLLDISTIKPLFSHLGMTVSNQRIISKLIIAVVLPNEKTAQTQVSYYKYFPPSPNISYVFGYIDLDGVFEQVVNP